MLRFIHFCATVSALVLITCQWQNWVAVVMLIAVVLTSENPL